MCYAQDCHLSCAAVQLVMGFLSSRPFFQVHFIQRILLHNLIDVIGEWQSGSFI